jgi:hypothetical protein
MKVKFSQIDQNLNKMDKAIKLDNLKNHAFVAMWSPSRANLWNILYCKNKFSCDVIKTSTIGWCHAPSCHCSYSMSWISNDIIITQVYHLIIWWIYFSNGWIKCFLFFYYNATLFWFFVIFPFFGGKCVAIVF